VQGLSARHAAGGRGIFDVGFVVERGQFVVVTGAVGSGKTTLVRAMLGLFPMEAGTVRWNGAVVDDPSSLGPPRIAYAGQVPRLFSATLEENLRLGWPAEDVDVAAALRAVGFDRDLAELQEGLGTLVGPRGTRLSGGQAQRVATARALVRHPELLVVDDLGSALDVETEAQVWDGVLATAPACLAVSHRLSALARADHIVVLDRGRVVGQGTAHDLVRTCPEFRRLWQGEAVEEAEEAVAGVAG